MVFPFTVPLDPRGHMRDAAQGVYARSLARTLAERLSLSPQMSATAATLTANGPIEGLQQTKEEEEEHGWVVASQPWSVEEACHIGLPDGMEYVLHGAAELTDRIRLRLMLVDQPRRALAVDHVVLRPRAELFAALEEAARVVAQALGEDLPQIQWPTSDVEAYLAYLRGRDLSAAHEAGVRVPDPTKSFDAYLEATRRDPQFLDAQDRLLALALDFALGGQGPVATARASCDRLLALDPGAYKAHAALAEMDLADGDPASAEGRLLKVLQLRPDWWPVFERLGTALIRMERYAEALPWFEKALDERPQDTDALQGYGVALAEVDRLEEAVATWQQALELDTQSVHLHDNLARALWRLGRRSEAREHRAAARRLSGKPSLGLYLFREAWQWLTGNDPAARSPIE
jgi:tetratricopeptide (TPR) repeat protein